MFQSLLRRRSQSLSPSLLPYFNRNFLFLLLSVIGISALPGVFFLGTYKSSSAFPSAGKYSFASQNMDRVFNKRLLVLANSGTPTLRIIKTQGLEGLEETGLPWRKHLREGQGLEWFDAKGKHLVSAGNTAPNAPLAKVLFSSRLNKQEPVIEQHGHVRCVSVPVFTEEINEANQKIERLEGYIRASELTHQVELEAKALELWKLELVELTLLFLGITSAIGTFFFVFKPLKQRLKQLQHFNADVVHELRNPLTAINIATEVMQSHSEQLNPYITKKLGIIISCTDQLTRLVDDLSILSQLDAVSKSSRINHSLVPLDELLQDVVRRFEPQALKREIHFESYLPNGIFVNGDNHQLIRLASNLLENAFKYTAAAGRVSLVLGRDKRFAIIRVEDTGIGIPQEKIPFIFERFWRSDKARTKQKDGLGLGLAIVKSIVQRHGGQIKVRSKVGVGSSFLIYLPLSGTRSA